MSALIAALALLFSYVTTTVSQRPYLAASVVITDPDQIKLQTPWKTGFILMTYVVKVRNEGNTTATHVRVENLTKPQGEVDIQDLSANHFDLVPRSEQEWVGELAQSFPITDKSLTPVKIQGVVRSRDWFFHSSATPYCILVYVDPENGNLIQQPCELQTR